LSLRRTKHSGITHSAAGCFDCWGDEGRWFGRNALALAARHCDATGHNTWADQTISVEYNRPPKEVR
jgi:hypothetical protein